MNKRIRQLVRQAGLNDADFPIEDWDNVPLAKFAQLIVRECVSIAESADDDTWKRDDKGTEIAKNIQQYFGVEK